MKKIIPALAMLLLAAVLMGTSTFAWFSMNTKVAVTGMEVKAGVANNLMIAETAYNTTAKTADANFKYGLVTTHAVKTLDPVSSVDGAAFFYTSTKNVKANGDAVADKYVAYDAYDSTKQAAFESNYMEGAVGYVDYAFQLKADNAVNAVRYLNLTKLKLTYGGAADAEKAFRVAIFVDDMGEDGSTAAAGAQSTTNLLTILSPASAVTFDDKAVNSVSSLGDINSKANAAAMIGTVAANKTNYYQVVVRLWLEGEDKTCNNTTFADLTDAWALDLEFELAETTGGVTALAMDKTSAKIDLTSAAIGTDNTKFLTIDNVEYKPITGHDGYYVTGVTAIASDTVIYYIADGTTQVYDVTNACTLPAPVVTP